MKKFIITSAAILATASALYMYNSEPTVVKFIDADEKYEVPFAAYEIINENGEVIKEDFTDETGVVELSALEKGSYFIKAKVAGYAETIRKVSVGLLASKTVKIALD